MPFIKFMKSKNTLMLILVKWKKEGIICDLDGDRLFDIALERRGE